MIFVRDLYHLSRVKFIIDILLMVALGTLEGIGVLMIIPLLMAADIIPGMQPGGAAALGLEQFFQSTGIRMSLPFVLVVYTAVIFGQSWLQRRQVLLNFEIQQKFGVSLSIRLFRAIAYAKWQMVVSKTKSDLTNVLLNELIHIYSGINLLLQMVASILLTIIQVMIAFVIAPDLTCSVLVGIFILFMLLRKFFKESRRLGQDTLDLNRGLFQDLTQHFDGLKDVKGNGIESAQIHSFIKTRNMMMKNLIALTKLQTRSDMLNKAGAAVFISIFLFAAIEVFKLKPQQLILVSVITARLWPRLSSLQMGFLNIQTLLPSFRAAKELEEQCLDAQEDWTEDGAYSRLELKHGVEFRNVSFCYEAARIHYAVVNANFVLPVKTTTAFVGVSGSGKSTLVDLLTGLLTPVKGDILVDGDSLSEHVRPWRNSIGYVPQDPFLLNASIKNNLLWVCPNALEKEIWEALRLAAIDTFVMNLPKGLDTVIGDRGVRISGGERQRLVLARALLRKPSVLILDEATSSLDSENEKRIQKAIENLQGKLTIVVIAHRLSTIRNADQIIVMEQGRILEQGNYRSLMRNRASRFYSLACSYAE